MTKKITECYRGINELLIIGGVLGAIIQMMIFLLNPMESKHLMHFGKSLSVTTALLIGLFQIVWMLKRIDLMITL